MENVKHFIEKLPVIGKYFGSVYEQKLYFVPDAQNEPGDDDKHEVSEAALFRFLLNEQTLKHCKEVQAVLPDMLDVLKTIDKESEITEFEAHQSSMGKVEDLKGAFHVFIVFKTTKKRENETADDDEVYWWSLEKGMDYITLQRSSNKENVKDKCYGEPRNQTKPIVENLIGKGTIKDLFAVLWAQQVIPEEYNILNSNCQSFVTFVSTQITQDKYKFEGFFPYSPPESDRKTEMLDLTNLLTGVTDWHPLFTLIFLENTRLFDTLTKGGEYNMGITQYGFTLLNFVIVFSKTKMVEFLLNPPYSADPTIRDDQGRNALEMAAVFTEQPEIFDLLLAHEKVKIDDVDESGRTALHAAAYVSNVAAVKHLLASGANFSLCEKYGGRSPLHQAASINRRTTEILDLILEAKKAKTGNQGIDDVDDKHGMTALHCAAYSSNEITAEHLIEKGADVNRRIKDKDTPLHYAAFGATDMKIIDLLLENIKDGEIDQYKDDVTLLGYACNNMHGLEGEIIERLVAKGIFNNEQVKNPQLLEALNAVKQQVAQYLRSKSSNGLGGAMANRMEEAGSDRDKQPYGYIEATYEDFRATYKSSADVGGIEHFIGDNAIQMEDKVGQVFKMALKNAIEKSDVEKARCLSKQFEAELSKVTWRGGRNALHAASHFAKTTDLIDVILERGKFDINGVDTHGKTALFYAINARNLITVGYLLEKGADPTIGIHDGGITQFQAAAALSREPDILDLFLANNKQFDIDHRNQSGLTALHMAIRVSNTAAAKFLLSNGANPNAADENGYTPLHVAAKYAKDMDIVELLLDRKDTNVDYLDNEGNNALHYAMGNEHGLAEEIANLLREKMAAKSEGSSHEPKKIATLVPGRIEEDSDIKTIRLLMESGEDVSAMTWGENGANALHVAAAADAKTTDLIDLILETGKFDINGVDSDGNTPLHYAILAGSNAATNAHYLLKKKADPTVHNNEKGLTPFHTAAALSREPDILGLFLANNKQFDIDHRNQTGMTALHMAIKESNTATAEFLLSNGANPNAADENGFTPLHVAAYYAKDMDIVKLLVNRKDVNVNYSEKCGHRTLRYAKHNMHGLGEAIANLLREKMAAKTEGSNHEPKKIAATVQTGRIKEDSDIKTIRLLIENGQDISAMTWGENGANALHLAAADEETTELIDISLDTESRDPHVTTTPECTSDVDNENWVKEVLTEAIIHADAEKVRNLIETGADLGKVTWRGGRNALHAASQHAQKTEILDVILATGDFDINGRDTHEDGWTPLHFALRYKNITTARHLLEKGADPTIGTHDGGITQFHAAAAYVGESDILDLFLANNKQFDIDHRNKSGMTALHMAIRESNTAAAEFLLSNGANPNATDENGYTPLHVAAKYAKDMAIVELLLDRKDVNVKYLDKSGHSALQYAMSNEHGLGEAIANLLREKMATKAEEINYEPENIAALVPAGRIKQDSDTETIRLLIEDGQDISAMTWGENGANALHLAAANEETTELIDAILKTGKFDIDGVDNDGRTPLHYAIMGTNYERNVPHLIGKGADPNIADNNGITPLHMAVIHAESMDLIDILLKTKKLNVNDYDDNGLAARDCARYNKHGLGDTIIARLTEYIEMESPTELSASRTIILACICFCLLAYVVSALQNI